MTMALWASPKGSQSSCPQLRRAQLKDYKAGKIPSTPSNIREPSNTADRTKSLLGMKKYTHAADTHKADGDSEQNFQSPLELKL